jgi:hypothetical protein
LLRSDPDLRSVRSTERSFGFGAFA